MMARWDKFAEGMNSAIPTGMYIYMAAQRNKRANAGEQRTADEYARTERGRVADRQALTGMVNANYGTGTNEYAALDGSEAPPKPETLPFPARTKEVLGQYNQYMAQVANDGEMRAVSDMRVPINMQRQNKLLQELLANPDVSDERIQAQIQQLETQRDIGMQLTTQAASRAALSGDMEGATKAIMQFGRYTRDPNQHILARPTKDGQLEIIVGRVGEDGKFKPSSTKTVSRENLNGELRRLRDRETKSLGSIASDIKQSEAALTAQEAQLGLQETGSKIYKNRAGGYKELSEGNWLGRLDPSGQQREDKVMTDLIEDDAVWQDHLAMLTLDEEMVLRRNLQTMTATIAGRYDGAGGARRAASVLTRAAMAGAVRLIEHNGQLVPVNRDNQPVGAPISVRQQQAIPRR